MTAQSEGSGNAACPTAHETDVAHMTTQRERRRLALAEIDKAPFGWYHVRAVVVAGCLRRVSPPPGSESRSANVV